MTDRNTVSIGGWFQPLMSANTVPAPFVASASTSWSGAYEPFRAFDNNILTDWFSSQTPRYSTASPGLYTGAVSTTVSGVAVLGEWIQLAFTSVVISTYTIVVADLYKNNSVPTSWVVAGSTNGGTTWTVLDTQTRTWTGTNSRAFNIPFPIAINAIRIIIKETYNVAAPLTYTTISQFILS